jgi:hypothetical protein
LRPHFVLCCAVFNHPVEVVNILLECWHDEALNTPNPWKRQSKEK